MSRQPPSTSEVLSGRPPVFLQQLLLARPQSVFGQFVRYLFVGGAAFVADFATLTLLAELRVVGVVWAAAAGFLVGTFVNYLLAIRWVFTVRQERDSRVEFLSYLAIGAFGLLLNQVIIWLLAVKLPVHYMPAKLVAATLVLAWNFLARKLLLFKE